MRLVDSIRKTAALEEGRRSFEELAGRRGRSASALDLVLMRKAGAADPSLLAIAGALCPERPLATYEAVGGTYALDRGR